MVSCISDIPKVNTHLARLDIERDVPSQNPKQIHLIALDLLPQSTSTQTAMSPLIRRLEPGEKDSASNHAGVIAGESNVKSQTGQILILGHSGASCAAAAVIAIIIVLTWWRCRVTRRRRRMASGDKYEFSNGVESPYVARPNA